MQDLGDEPRVGRRRLSAVPGGERLPPLTPGSISVVPAQRVLEVASALSDGATRLHAQLRHLGREDRDAVMDLVAEQVGTIVTLWSDLVRGVVTVGEPVSQAEDPYADESPGLGRPAVISARPDDMTGGHPARVAVAEAGAEGRSGRPGIRHQTGGESRDAERLTHDELTGVLNRQAGFAALARDIDRCRRGSERFVLGFLNVDGMKTVNDTGGTRAGDELLRKVTAALRATLRSYDVVGRLGGDEFLFSLPGADLSTAELRLKEFAVILAEEAPGSSASVGFAELHQHDSLDDLVAAAEAAMLKSRRTRRRGRA